MKRRRLNAADFDLNSCIFISIFILGLGFLTMLSSIGFPVSRYNLFIICGLSLLFSNFSVTYRTVSLTLDKIGLDAIQTVLLFFAILTISFFPNSVTSILVFIMAISGYLSFLFLLSIIEGGLLNRKLIPSVVFPVLLLVWILGFIYSSGIHHPLFFERIVLGTINRDLLFHSTVAEMFNTYGTPSTGLYGTPYLSYHYGSHVLLATFSNLLKSSALYAYSNLFPLFFIPLYFRVMLFLSKDLMQAIYGHLSRPKADWFLWISVVAININFLPNEFLQNWAIWDGWALSESYLLSLTFLFLSVSIALAVLRVKDSIKFSLAYSTLLCIISLFMGFCKMSTIMVAACAIVYMVLRSGKWRSPTVLLNLIILVAIVGLVYKATAGLNVALVKDGFYPFHFIKIWTNDDWRSMFVLMFFFFILFYFLVRLNLLKVKNFQDLKNAIRLKKLLDLEFLLAVAVIGFVPVAFLSINGGSAVYFADIQTRLTLPFILSWVLFNRNKPFEHNQNIGSFLRRNSFIFLVAVLFMLNNVISKFEKFLNTNLQLRLSILKLDPTHSSYYGEYNNFYHYFSGNPKVIKKKMVEIAYLPGKVVTENNKYLYYKWLVDTCRGVMNKKDYYLALSKGSSFWQDGHVRPEMAPFILTSLTGMALSNGLPDDYKTQDEYGYLTYRNLQIEHVNCGGNFDKEILFIDPYQYKLDKCR